MNRLMPIALLASLLIGCAPSPQDVCKHIEEIDKDAVKNCDFRMQMMKDTKREQYNKLAPCIMDARDKDAFNKCLELHQK
jgi:hypothetical protein